MARITVDVDALLVQLLTPRLPGLTVMESTDPQAAGVVPLLTCRGVTGHMVSNGNYKLGWEWVVACQLLANATPTTSSRDNGSALADQVYQQIHGLHEDHASLPGMGGVSYVDDVSMFTLGGTTALQDQQVTQFDATFQIIVRPN